MSHHTSDLVCPACEEKLSQADEYLYTWFHNRVKPAHPDAHVAWSFRDEQSQNEACAERKSNLKWPHSAHNHQEAGKPVSRALDLFEINEDGVGIWNPKFFRTINDENEIANLPIAWGGLFRGLGDFDHFELLHDVD